jgi:hypothetical protein
MGGACRFPWHTNRVLCETSSLGCARLLVALASYLFAWVWWSLKDPPQSAILWGLGIFGEAHETRWTTVFDREKPRGSRSEIASFNAKFYAIDH